VDLKKLHFRASDPTFHNGDIAFAYVETIGENKDGEGKYRRLWAMQEGVWKFDNCKPNE